MASLGAPPPGAAQASTPGVIGDRTRKVSAELDTKKERLNPNAAQALTKVS